MSIRPQMTGQQAEALAAYLVTLRPGQRAWTKTAVFDQLTTAAETRTNDTELLTRAALAAALDPRVVTPDVIPMTGRHWDSVGDYAKEPPRPQRCTACHAVDCPGPDCCVGTPAERSYAADAKAQIRPTWHPQPQETT